MSAALDSLLTGVSDSQAANRLRQTGLPTPRDEAWKFTSLRPLEKMLADGGKPGQMPDVPAPLMDNATQIILRNGSLDKAFTPVNGIKVNTGDAIDGRDSSVGDLVAALGQTSLSLQVEKGAVPGPVELVILSDGSEGAARPLALSVRVPEQAELTLIERHLGDGAYLNAVASAIQVDGRLQHIKVQDDSAEGFHLADSAVTVGRAAHYDRFILSLGSRLARDEVHTHMAGEGAALYLRGAYAGSGQQHLDHTTHIDHAVPHTTSHEVYKGVLDDAARGVFQGGILVRPGAQKTDGHQLNKALLLSPKAEIDSKPALEIYADDVKCSHGATTGEIEADQLFYLKARGVPEPQARALLVQAFMDEMFDHIADETLRTRLLGLLHAKIGEAG